MLVADMLRPALLALAIAGLAACASAPKPLVTGQARAAIDPAEVSMYYGPPDVPYEEIAILEVSSGSFTYGENNKRQAVLERLRQQAASVGANGVIFRQSSEGRGGSGVGVGVGGGRIGGYGYGGVGVGINVSPKRRHASGVAIYMPQKPAQQEALPVEAEQE